jgi:hypothetical protein
VQGGKHGGFNGFNVDPERTSKNACPFYVSNLLAL